MVQSCDCNYRNTYHNLLVTCRVFYIKPKVIDFPTELAQQHTHVMQKENHHRELNDELKDENTMLHKKLQGKPCISAKSLARVMETNALMQT